VADHARDGSDGATKREAARRHARIRDADHRVGEKTPKPKKRSVRSATPRTEFREDGRKSAKRNLIFGRHVDH
jgi:hypothetical protein